MRERERREDSGERGMLEGLRDVGREGGRDSRERGENVNDADNACKRERG